MRVTGPSIAAIAVLILAACADDPEDRLEQVLSEFEVFEETIMRHEELIADCMAQEGFEYIAALPADVEIEKATVIAESQGDLDPIDPNTLQLPENPNVEIVSRLSEPERSAYETAYWGTEREAGCYGATYLEAWGTDPFAPTEEDLADGAERIARAQSSDAAQAAERAYVECMRAEGWEVEGVDGVFALERDMAVPVAAAALEQGVSFEESPLFEDYEESRRRLAHQHDECYEPYGSLIDEAVRRSASDGG
ncbi:MAG: hypothetical protein GY698_24050 [Actinomycetia bacterium]|nr:hypothetical protein [Actinomycetes bacterium]